ncbi:MAG TPA: phosphatidate cytidylyltransferase [Longimicrobiales bacterium]
MPRSELTQRVAVAAIGIPVAVAAIHAGGWILGALLAVVAAGGALELFRLVGHSGVRALPAFGAAGAAVFVLIVAWRPTVAAAAPPMFGAAVALLLLVTGAAVWLRGVEGKPLFAVATTVFGAIFPGWTLAHVLLLRHAVRVDAAAFGAPSSLATSAWAGAALVIYAIGLTWINDTCAYFAGRAWGRRKLIPRVSPGKTVIGAVAGGIGTVVVGAVYGAMVLEGWYDLPVGPWKGAAGGLLIAVAALVGDLAESAMKREAGVKDSGHLLPGHGGILDRFDALFFAIPVAFWYLMAILAVNGGAR